MSFNSAIAEDITLGKVRKELLQQKIVIYGDRHSGIGQTEEDKEFLFDWYLAKGDLQQGYEKRTEGNPIGEYAPYELKGKRGIVRSIELADIPFFQKGNKGTSTDLFGDKVKDSDVIEPYINLVVELQDGTLLITTGFYNTLLGHQLELASTIDAIKSEMPQMIEAIIGKTIFPVAYSNLFSPDVDVKIITGPQAQLFKLRGIPNLTPLKIIKAKYVEEENRLLLKVEFLGGKTGIIFSPIDFGSGSRKVSPLQRATLGFLTESPKDINAKEIKAIREGSIFTGMSLTALYYSWGFPKKKNNWGRAGEQLFYTDQLIVYIQNKKVVDWQSLSK